MELYLIVNNSNETLEVISDKTLAKYGIEIKSEDKAFLKGSGNRAINIFGWGELNAYSIEKAKEYREFYEAEGWDYIENICL